MGALLMTAFQYLFHEIIVPFALGYNNFLFQNSSTTSSNNNAILHRQLYSNFFKSPKLGFTIFFKNLWYCHFALFSIIASSVNKGRLSVDWLLAILVFPQGHTNKIIFDKSKRVFIIALSFHQEYWYQKQLDAYFA